MLISQVTLGLLFYTFGLNKKEIFNVKLMYEGWLKALVGNNR
jgi:hypothetical protein